jgi:hypothetical protein
MQNVSWQAGHCPILLSRSIMVGHWHKRLQHFKLRTVLRIRDVYPGSRILIFTYPGSRISDPGSKNRNKSER